MYLMLLLLLLPFDVAARVLVFSLDYRQEPQAEFEDRQALFGGALPDDGLKGLLVYTNMSRHCKKMDYPPSRQNPFRNWFVLIPRTDDECSFEDMVYSAQNANFSAVIVYNTQGNRLESMSARDGNGDEIYIPAIFVTEEAGIRLRSEYTWNCSYYIVINDDIPFDFNAHLLLPFAIVVGICFMAMLVFMVVKCIKDQRRARRHRLPSSSLRKIPTARFQKGDPYETCAICLEDYAEGDKLRVLPCSHAYHTKCIDPWLTRNRRVCPVCKRKVFAHDEEQIDDSDTDSEGGQTTDTTPLLSHEVSSFVGGGTFETQQPAPYVRATGVSRGSQSSLSSVGSTGWSRVLRSAAAEATNVLGTSSSDSSSNCSNVAVNVEPVNSTSHGNGPSIV